MRVDRGGEVDARSVIALDGLRSGRKFRHRAAVIEAIAKGRNRVLLVMATGSGKTYTAFQIIWRLWKAGRAKRVLYLGDRNVLIEVHLVLGAPGARRPESLFDDETDPLRALTCKAASIGGVEASARDAWKARMRGRSRPRT
jgi:Type III restriction enzyme, res subunit